MAKNYSIEELEAYRIFAAYMVLEFGPEYGFVLERVEGMLERARREDPVTKARRVMEEIKAAHGVLGVVEPRMLLRR
jgi:hypothetical protein